MQIRALVDAGADYQTGHPADVVAQGGVLGPPGEQSFVGAGEPV